MIASKKSRLFARIFDLLIILFLQLISTLLIGIENGSGFVNENALIIATLNNLISLVVILYFLFADSLPNGQSLGKKVFGIAVVR